MSFCAISSKGSDAFATLSSVGRLSVFRRDAAAQLLVEPQGAAAAAAPTCLKLRGSVAVVGKQDGSIVVWDLLRGTSRTMLSESSSPVADVAIREEYLYGTSQGRDIFEWRLDSGKLTRSLRGDKVGTSKLSVSNASTPLLAAGSMAIYIIDLTSGKRVAKLSDHHTSQITHLEFSRGGEFLCSSCVSSRFVNVFRVMKDKKAELLRTLTLHQNPTSVSISYSGGNIGKSYVTLSAGIAQGATLLRFHDQSDDANVETRVIEGQVLAVDLETTAKLVAVHGTPALPLFDSLTYGSESGKLLAAISLPARKGSDSGEQGRHIEKDELYVLGPGDLSSQVREVDGAIERQPKRIRSSSTDSEGITIAQRLEALSSALQKTPNRSIQTAHNIPATDSLATILEQALQSSDDTVLETCLSESNEQVMSQI